MRKVTCRFASHTSFLRHYHPNGDSGRCGISFIGEPGLGDGEILRMVLIIEQTGERHTLHMRICDRRPTLEGPDDGIYWRYRATVTDGDAPWLNMLAEKAQTAQRFESPARSHTDGAA